MAVLGLSLWLIPEGAEIRQARIHDRSIHAQAAAAGAAQAVRPAPPQLSQVLRSADAPRIAAAVAALKAEGIAVTSAQVVHDLDRLGRTGIALDYIAALPQEELPALWRLRFEMTRRVHGSLRAQQLVEQATAPGSRVPARDVTEAAYAVQRPDLVLAAAENGVVPPPDTALSLDLARRFEQAQRTDLVTRLDAVSPAPWRRADPWLALRLARVAGRWDEALGLVALLPASERDAAREAIMRDRGDRAGIRALLMERAARPGSDAAAIAEQLLAGGFRADALALLMKAAAGAPVADRTAQRLVYLMGPRPAAGELRWLQARTLQGTPTMQRGWIDAYAPRDRPAGALAFLTRHPLASTPDVQLLRLSLANAADDTATASALFATLVDNRALTAAQLHALRGEIPRKVSPALARRLTERRVANGTGTRQDQMDLAWAAWNRGDASGTVSTLNAVLADRPDDVAALRLMADAQRKLKGEAAARPWREKALAVTPAGSRTRAELLESLGRYDEAVAEVDGMLADLPADRTLTAYKARLLLASGQPGRARKVLQP